MKMVRVLLIRHTEVAAQWQGRCYGQMDAGLSAAGREAARHLAQDLVVEEAASVVTSPLRRARLLGGLIARRSGAQLAFEARLCECNFGSWEGRSWDSIYAETGSAMMGMTTAPDQFRPGGGETTFELRDRAMAWLESLPRNGPVVVAIAHGGPIAAIRGTLSGVPVQDWPSLVPGYGACVEISL